MEKPKRCTIGVFTGYHIYEGSHPGPIASPLICGMQAAAQQKSVHFMVACGVARRIGSRSHRPAWPELSQETNFVPIGAWNTALGLEGIQPQLLVDQADRVLYQTKYQGRNGAVIYKKQVRKIPDPESGVELDVKKEAAKLGNKFSGTFHLEG